jgi:acyl-CoA thioesterase I
MIHLRLLPLRYAALRAIRNGAAAMIFAISPAFAESVTVVALGDSLTAGYGLTPEAGLVPQLEGWLKAQGADVVIVNAGVSGDTTAGGLSRLDWSLTPETDALIVTLGANDMLRGLPPAEARANLTAILEGAKAKALPVLLVGIAAPGNYGANYKAEFDAIYPDLAAQYGTLLYPGFFDALTMGNPDPTAVQAFMQGDGIHPNAEGVKKIVEGLGPKVAELIAALQP